MDSRLQLECVNLMHFPNLNAMPNFVGVLRNIQTQFKTRYESIEKLEIWFSSFDTPFTVDFKDIQDAELQMELSEIRCDHRLREKFMNSSSTKLIEFNRTLPDSQFPNLMRNTAETLAMFLRTYSISCEQAFSVMKLIKTQHRARISDNNLRNSLRICVSNNIHPGFKDMIKFKKMKKLTE
ncbi:hypothetical protein C0J52_13829 [Blattella germanica]|nr:hypothetical protein C0J52_13829 [Blattella germanica]